jgi:hypothetical protein
MGDPPLELKHGAERYQRQGLERLHSGDDIARPARPGIDRDPHLSFARINAALKMKVEDLRPRGAGWTIRLHKAANRRFSIRHKATLQNGQYSHTIFTTRSTMVTFGSTAVQLGVAKSEQSATGFPTRNRKSDDLNKRV